MSVKSFRLLAAICFFITGATSLVYQVVWSRYLGLIFGSAHYSVATVVAAYMLGLGLGAWLIGRIADRSPRPGRLYALLELGIAAYGALSPWFFRAIEHAFVAWHRSAEPSAATATVMKLLLALVALALPTLLMGGTLPVLGRALVSERQGSAAADVGALYAWNTLGAVAGAASAGFLLVERLGLARSLQAAALLNALVACAVLAARPGSAPLPPAEERPRLADLARGAVARFALAAAFVSGFASLADEVVWTRVLGLLTGSSTWAFTVILSTFLLGVGLGARWSAANPPRSAALRLAWAQILAALGASLLLLLFRPAAALILASGQNPLSGWASLFAIRGLVALITVVPATFGFGASFPALVALTQAEGRRTGSQIGILYAANTLGAILGSLASGFLLLTWFSSYGVLRAGVFASLAIAAVAIVIAGADRVGRLARALPALAVAGVALLMVLREPWPAHILDLGPAVYLKSSLPTPLDLEAFMARGSNQVTFFREGPVSTVSVRDAGHSLFLRVNGKTDASTTGDMTTQISVGLLPLLEHPAPRRALLIGAGSGVTARVMADTPGVESLDVVEIEPAVIEAGRFFEGVIGDVYRRPSVRLHIDDGRNFMLTSKSNWDVIVSEPSNPWMAGIANLFTLEYYALARSRLAEGGVFCQWLQRYDMTEPTLKRLLATLLASFPQVELWRGGPGDLLLLAGAQPLRMDQARVRQVLAHLDQLRPGELDGFLAIDAPEDLPALYLLGDAGLRRFAGEARPFSDDPPELEFAAFRDLGSDPRWAPRTNRGLMEVKRELRDGAPAAIPEHAMAVRAYGMARVLLSFQETGPAELLLTQALNLAPEPRFWRWLGETRLAAGNATGAEEAWGQAAADPREVLARVRLSRARLQRLEIEAASQLAPGAAAAPGHLETVLLDAELALAQGRYADALSRLRETWALRRFTNDPPALFDRLYPLFVALAGPQAAPELTLAEIGRAVAAEPRLIEWRVLRSDLLQRLGRDAEAAAEFDWLRRHGIRSAETLQKEGECLLRLGRREEALARFEELGRYEPWRVDRFALEARR